MLPLSVQFFILLISYHTFSISLCSQYNFYHESNVYKEYLKNVHPNSINAISCRNCSNRINKRETIDTTFHGHPKTREERWHAAFKTDTSENSIKDAFSLVQLLSKIVDQYLNACIPIILYDTHVEHSNGIILETLFKNLKTSYLHGKISKNYTMINKDLLNPIDSRCRNYILFLSDVKRTREILGPQTVDRVVVIPLSSQWKLQEFLSSKLSSDIVNLLVISKSVSAGMNKSDTFVLYTHRLFTDGLGSNKPIVLTSWINGKLSRPNVNLFPKKFLRGYAGHRFAVSSIHQPPYVIKKLSTDAGGNIAIDWDGLEFRILKLLAKRLNFTFDISEPQEYNEMGPTYGVVDDVALNKADIGVAGAYVTIERLGLVEMSVQHSKDCAAFITLASKSLPRYRAIMGPFQWPVWLAIIIIYIVAIFPLAFSDRLTLKHLIGNWSEMENMFWYVFGTFTNSLTFSGKFSWSNTKRNSTRMLIGWYWVFTIIITACYTGSIIAFVTLPVIPETVDSISDLLWGFYRIGTLYNDGWQYWFTNSSHGGTLKLLKDLEFVANVEEGLSNVTKAFFWPYAFLGSRSRLEFIVEANFSDNALGKTTALHISDTCLSIFGISYLFSLNNVYINRIDDMILRLQQSGLIAKLNNELEWERQRDSKGTLLKITSYSKSLQSANFEDRKLTLADTEGMFLLMGIGYSIAFSVLLSEIIGGCAKKCREFVRRPSKMSINSATSNPPNSSQIIPDINAADDTLSSNQSSANSFEITTKMLHRKSVQSDSTLNPFKSYFMRHRRHHSLVASETERHNVDAKKRFSLEENHVVSSSLNDIDENGGTCQQNVATLEVHQVEINRIQTPYVRHYSDDTDDDDNSIDKTMGEKIYN